MPSLPLSSLRIVELGSGNTLGYCGKLFADFGAEVVKIEPPGGDPLRRTLPPLLPAPGGEMLSGTFAWLNTNKRSITADLESEAGANRVIGLAADAELAIADIGTPKRCPRLVDENLQPLAEQLIDVDFQKELGAPLEIEAEHDLPLREPVRHALDRRTRDQVRNQCQEAGDADSEDKPDFPARLPEHGKERPTS